MCSTSYQNLRNHVEFCLCNFLCFFIYVIDLNNLSQNGQGIDFSSVWVTLCPFRPPISENFFEQSPHSYGFSPVCTLLCFRSSPEPLKDFLQSLHSKGLSPVCTRMCVSRLDENNLLQNLQGLSLTRGSPECTFWCSFKPLASENVLPHWSHLKGRSPVCTLLCLLSLAALLRTFPQSLHGTSLSLPCTSLWCFRCDEVENPLLHWLHT